MSTGYKMEEAARDRAIAHMNEDHADALLRYAHYFGGRKDAQEAEMTGLDAEGFDLEITTAKGREPLRIGFEKPLAKDGDAHTRLVSMAVEARRQEG